MKFEKINDNKLKITIDQGEIPYDNNLEDFMSDSSNARTVFLSILEAANEKIGFNTENYKIKIDAQSLLDGNLVLFITKLVKLDCERITVKPQKIFKNNISKTQYSIYCFESFDDFCTFCEYLKLNKISCPKSFAKSIQLFSYCNKYYLSLHSINSKYKKINCFYTSITEFAKYYPTNKFFASVLIEKGSLVLDNSAIATCQKYFITRKNKKEN